MEMLQFDRSAYTAMQARIVGTDGRQISLNEYAAAGVFALAIDFSDAFDSLATGEPVENMTEAAAWINLAEAASRYHVTQDGLRTGLLESAARVMLKVAVNIGNLEQVFVQLAADPATALNGGAMSHLNVAITLLGSGGERRAARLPVS